MLLVLHHVFEIVYGLVYVMVYFFLKNIKYLFLFNQVGTIFAFPHTPEPKAMEEIEGTVLWIKGKMFAVKSDFYFYFFILSFQQSTTNQATYH